MVFAMRLNVVFIFTCCLLSLLNSQAAAAARGAIEPQPQLIASAASHARSRGTLVLYLFAAVDDESYHNLRFFVEYGVKPDTTADYLLALHPSAHQVQNLPQLPEHAKYLHYHSVNSSAGDCAWGIYGELLTGTLLQYKHYIMVQSIVKGPFLPAFSSKLPWTSIFTSRINSDVKLVGATISCEPAAKHEQQLGAGNSTIPVQPAVRSNPHVQSYLLATDSQGLAVMMSDPQVFQCYSSASEAMFFSELGASLAILHSGSNIDCLMTRYQNVDWRMRHNWACNNRLSPLLDHTYDGITVMPLEVLFVKAKSHLVATHTASSLANSYQQWMQDNPAALNATTLASNSYIASEAQRKARQVLMTGARGSTDINCFDYAYYKQNSPDLQALPSDQELWKHYMYFGQFEGRKARFSCEFDQVKLLRVLEETS